MKLQKILLTCVLSILCFACGLPSNETVEKEFLAKNPNTEVVSAELIFEQDDVLTYLIKHREKSNNEIKMKYFNLREDNWKWRVCDDQTEEKCTKKVH
jgi:hypothetical protein